MSTLNKQILRLSIPSILANITIPFVGMVDVAIIGHISNASAIGGIAIGTMLFDLLYWNFGFLRIGTSGLTAQAFGRKDLHRSAEILAQTTAIAFLSAMLVWAIQWLFVTAALALIPCSPEVAGFARKYFFVRIWAAPATLMLMAFKGWFIGMQDTVSPMLCDIIVNVVNMAASYWLAVHSPLGIIGVAYGTVIAQYLGLAVAFILLFSKYASFLRENFHNISIFNELNRLFRLSTDLFVRSLCFMAIYVGFTVITSWYGDVQLALGTIMMKLFMLFSYFVDGFAYAGEALVGRYVGERDETQINASVRLLFVWTFAVGMGFTVLYALVGDGAIRLMTSDATVIAAAKPFLLWLILMPVISAAAFMWDGIYFGATAGKEVRNCMIFSAVGFIASYFIGSIFCGIQAVYIGYFVHLCVRTVYLSVNWRKTRSAILVRKF